MASTDQRAGFRLPWSGSTPAPEGEGADAPEEAVSDTASETMVDQDMAQQAGDAPEAAAETPGEEQMAAEAAPTPTTAPLARKPARFVTELVRAMRAELEKHRDATLEQFRIDATNHVELVHKRSADEVAELRRIADEDIAGIREWSKAEIARIKAETEERTDGRKTELESHLEEHAALIEREIEKVQARVGVYEREIEAFFTSLEHIDDPASFAAAAQQVPEPPSLEAAGAEARSEALSDLVRGRPAPDLDAPFDPMVIAGQPTEAGPQAPADEAADGQAEPMADAVADSAQDSAGTAEAEASAEASAETGADASAQGGEGSGDVSPDDPRLAALAMSDDMAAAESEAAGEAVAAVAEGTEPEPFPEIEADIVAARLNGLVPEDAVALNGASRPAAAAAPTDTETTQVIVVGLVSVASIAAFKRQLSRLPGVHSVGVSSGPDGEFIFKANHDRNVALQDVLTTLTGYSVRVVSTGDGVINVSARDPEN